MNERIKDIIGQNCVGEYYAGILCWRFSESQLEKFAELIVRDCALTAGIMEYEGRTGIGAQLLDNYGVEE